MAPTALPFVIAYKGNFTCAGGVLFSQRGRKLNKDLIKEISPNVVTMLSHFKETNLVSLKNNNLKTNA
jgi:hypothetical protein